MTAILNIIQIFVSLGIVALVVLTVRGGGLSRGDTTTQQSRRGPEKIAFYSLIILAVLFAALAISRLYFS